MVITYCWPPQDKQLQYLLPNSWPGQDGAWHCCLSMLPSVGGQLEFGHDLYRTDKPGPQVDEQLFHPPQTLHLPVNIHLAL